jgi:hypothetical protein
MLLITLTSSQTQEKKKLTLFVNMFRGYFYFYFKEKYMLWDDIKMKITFMFLRIYFMYEFELYAIFSTD